MYCVKCGVKLADTEKKCPLCGTVVYHPDIPREEGEPLYPKGKTKVPNQPRSFFLQYVITFLFVLPMIVSLECDLQLNKSVTWSGFVVGGLLLTYVTLVLPMWFRNPNPVCFVPSSFAALILYLLYINLAVDGNWFLTFAFPVVGSIGLVVTAVTALLYYVKRGKLFIYGGACMVMGGIMLLIEFLLQLTFEVTGYVGWSMYPCTGFVLIGGILIFLAICEPARETVERQIFL